MIGSTTDSGMPIAVEKVFWVIASSGAQRITATGGEDGDDADARHQPEAGAGVEHLAQLDRGQAAHRDRLDGAFGARRRAVVVRTGVAVAVLMLLLLHGRFRR